MKTNLPSFLTKFLTRKSTKIFLWLAGLGFLLYLPTLWFDFVYVDDNILILRDFPFLSNLANLKEIFRRGVFEVLATTDTYYRPLPTLTFMLDAQIYQTAAWGYHLTNILLHIIATILVFNLIKNFTSKTTTSLILSLIFLVHPALTSAVAWIPGRNDSLLTIFILASFLSWLKYTQNQNGLQKNILFLILHLIFFLLALLTKENSLLLPIIIIAAFSLLRPAVNFKPRQILVFLSWIGIIIIFYFLRKNALGDLLSFNPANIIKSFFINLPALIIYFGKTVLPFNLSGYPVLKDSALIFGLAAVFPLLFLLIKTTAINWRQVGFGGLWYLLFLLPTLVRTDLNPMTPLLEHRLYLPMFGFLLILTETDFFKKLNREKIWQIASALTVVAILAGMTLLYSQSYKNRFYFWENAVKNSPSSAFAYNNLGAMYYLDARVAQAGILFSRATELNDKEPMVYNNLGLVLMAYDKNDEAEAAFQKELARDPNYADAIYNLGVLYSRQEKFKPAVEKWEKVLELNPNYLDSYAQLANYYQKQGKDETKAQYYLEEFKKHGG
ncbi:MAG: TPR repeat-containing protein, partial [Candidatus Berkelbacteria bacterium Licking1014_7]